MKLTWRNLEAGRRVFPVCGSSWARGTSGVCRGRRWLGPGSGSCPGPTSSSSNSVRPPCTSGSPPCSCPADGPVLRITRKMKTCWGEKNVWLDVLETKPSLRPRSVKVTMPEMLVKSRLVKLRNPLADRVKPLPQPISTSAQPSAEVSLRKETLTDPEPVPLCVDSWPDKKAVSFNVNGASIPWLKLMPLTCTDGSVDAGLSSRVTRLDRSKSRVRVPYLPELFVFIRVRGEELSGIDGDGDSAAGIGPLVQPVFLLLLGQSFVLFSDLLRGLGPLHNLPALRLQALGA